MLQTLINCQIANHALTINGKQQFVADGGEPEAFFKQLYQHLNCEYPKFYKMDAQSKLGFLAVEALVQHYPGIKKFSDDDVALVFSNRSSSLDTDARFWKGVAAAEPVASPALFVYTLPNIVQGEIAIRNKWYGENIFLVGEEYNPKQLYQNAEILLQTGKANAVVAMWVDFMEGQYQAVCELLISKGE